jgi:carbon storage regulator
MPVLVLSRRAGESVVIADDVVVTVLEVRGDVIRLGIDAPRHVRVHREEVYREVQRANQAAAAASAEDVDLGALLAGREAEPPTTPQAP